MRNDIPVAICKKCVMKREVITFEFEGEQIVICPQCESILSDDNDVKVEWYSEDDL